jgi:deoxyadenosine/deoxycytidine kinase
VVLEQFENNEFLPLYYEELEKNGPTAYNKYSLPSQLQFLKSRISTELTCSEPHKVYIIERSIAEDRFIFVENMFRNGLLSQPELEEFDLRRAESSKEIDPVDIFIFLRADPNTLKTRITERGREMEQGISLEYLTNLNDLYENKLLVELQKPESNCRVLIYNVDTITKDELASVVQKDVENLLQDFAHRLKPSSQDN